MNAPRPCPCGQKASFADCCGPLLAGARQAETAEALMRSRYTAYVEGAVDYVIATTAAGARGRLDRAALVGYCRSLRGISLRILEVRGGGPLEETGVVEFAATLRAQGRTFVQRERSRFVREQGRWVYVDGDVA
jgi:SEC-C motif-containing protein